MCSQLLVGSNSNTTNTHKKGGEWNVVDGDGDGVCGGHKRQWQWQWHSRECRMGLDWVNEWKDLVWWLWLWLEVKWKNWRTNGWMDGWMDGCVSELLGESRTWIFNELEAVPLRHALLRLPSVTHCCTHTHTFIDAYAGGLLCGAKWCKNKDFFIHTVRVTLTQSINQSYKSCDNVLWFSLIFSTIGSRSRWHYRQWMFGTSCCCQLVP